MFILCSEILFILIKSDPKIKRIECLESCYFYTAYADDTTSFLKDSFKSFSDFSGLKPNTVKCKIAGIGVLKEVHEAICGMRYIGLRNKTVQILDIYFSHNQKIQYEQNLINIISDSQGVLAMRNLTLEGRMVVFKTLKIVHKIKKNSISSSFNKNPLPSGQRIRENTKIFSLKKFYSKNKASNNL